MTTRSNWIEKGAFVPTRPQGRGTPNLLRDTLKKTLQGGEKSAFRIPMEAISVRLKSLRTQVATIAKALNARSHVVQASDHVYLWLEKNRAMAKDVSRPRIPRAPKTPKVA